MFKQIIVSLEAVKAAINAKDSAAAQAAATRAVLLVAEVLGKDQSLSKQFYPIFVELKEEIRAKQFEEAWVTNLALLAKFRETQQVFDEKHPAFDDTYMDEMADRLDAQLGTPGIPVAVVEDSPEDIQPPLTATFLPRRNSVSKTPTPSREDE